MECLDLKAWSYLGLVILAELKFSFTQEVLYSGWKVPVRCLNAKSS